MKVFLLLTALMLWSLQCEARNAFDGGMLLGAGSSCFRKDASLLFEVFDLFEDDATREYKVNGRGFITNRLILF